jgi:hypothetical protein
MINLIVSRFSHLTTYTCLFGWAVRLHTVGNAVTPGDAMRDRISSVIVFAVACSLFHFSSVVLAQDTVTVHAVVTASTRLSEGLLPLPRRSIIVDLGRKPQEVFNWVPLRGTRAGLQLTLLIDGSSGSSSPLQSHDIGNFIEALPATTQLAIGYMQNGGANIVQPFTNDHEWAATMLRAPVWMTSPTTNRYPCLSDLVAHWPGANPDSRREVIMITDGVDPYSGWASSCADGPKVRATISDAQKSSVVVYSIFLAEKTDKNYLAQVANATGGKAYSLTEGYQVTLAAFLFDILCKLDNQYELSFTTASKNSLQPFEVRTTEPDIRLRAPESIWAKYRDE